MIRLTIAGHIGRSWAQGEDRIRKFWNAAANGKEFTVKLLIEIVLALVLHPVAVVLAWINLAGRDDLGGTKKLLWAVICLVWGIGPILYMLLADGGLW